MQGIFDKILGVLVLYKCKLEESETFISISRALKSNNQNLDLYVYDNSPEYHYNEDIVKDYPGNITYVHDKSNPGICKPYNKGLEIALYNNKKWLLLLDQDTELTDNYLLELNKVLVKDNSYVSVVPVVYSNNTIISPTRYSFLGRMKPIGKGEYGRIINNITAINSGACINVDFLLEIDGFNELFPLDMLDHWLYYEINKNKKYTFILNSRIKHNLSVNNYNTLTIERYERMIKSEKEFFVKIKHKKLIFKIKILLRLLKLCLHGRINFALKTIKYL